MSVPEKASYFIFNCHSQNYIKMYNVVSYRHFNKSEQCTYFRSKKSKIRVRVSQSCADLGRHLHNMSALSRNIF